LNSPIPSLFVIGSSTTVLFGPYLKKMVEGVYRYSRKGEEPSEMAAALRDLDVPQGASAGDSSKVLEHLHSLDRAGGFHPDVVLIHVGAHDMKQDVETGRYQVPLGQYRLNVEQIVAWFQARDIKLVWIRIGPLDETLHNARSHSFHRFEKDLSDYNEAAEAILRRRAVPILDLPGFTRSLGPMDEILKDHIHFKDEIVRPQAAYIAGYLSRMVD